MWPMTVFGASAPPSLHTVHHAHLMGPMGYVRFYFGPGARFGWNQGPLTARRAGDLPCVSVKTWNEQDFRTLLDTVPADVPLFYFTIAHEPEDEISKGTLTASKLQEWYRRARYIRSGHPDGGRCRLLFIFNRYQLVQRAFDWHRLGGALVECDVVGVDSYVPWTDLARGAYTPAEALFAPAVAIATETRLPWTAPEFGSRIATGSDGEALAEALCSYLAEARARGALWVSWWCSQKAPTEPNFHLEQPGMELPLLTWRAAVRATAQS